MKKRLLSALACGMVLGLFGCGGELPASIPAESTQETESFVESAAPPSQVQQEAEVSSSSAPREMGPPITEWYFTAGPEGEEKVLLGVGDEYMGFELVSIQGIKLEVDGDDIGMIHKFSATFEGEVAVTATLEYYSDFNAGFYIRLDDESQLPHAYSDKRNGVLFTFYGDSHDRLEEQFGTDFEEMECRITLTSFTIVCFERSVSNYAEFSHIEII